VEQKNLNTVRMLHDVFGVEKVPLPLVAKFAGYESPNQPGLKLALSAVRKHGLLNVDKGCYVLTMEGYMSAGELIDAPTTNEEAREFIKSFFPPAHGKVLDVSGLGENPTTYKSSMLFISRLIIYVELNFVQMLMAN